MISFRREAKAEWDVWTVVGRMDTQTSDTAEDAGMKILTDSTKMAINMQELNYISSAGLRVLLRMAKLAKADGKPLVLCGAAGLVKEVLEESGMDMLFTLKDTVDGLD